MPGVARATLDAAVGTITTGSPTVLVNGLPLARHGDLVANHAPGHNNKTLVSTNPLRGIFANGLRIAAAGDAATCGHLITTGSVNVVVGV
jgi:uncharacterized Zn-binding protein involved in type VI secretion